MGLFSSRRRSVFTPPAGLITTPQGLSRSVPFVFDTSNQPAVSLEKLPQGNQHVSLKKGHQAAAKALSGVELAGLLAEVVVMVDGSGSMANEYRRGLVQLMLTRALGFALNLDANGVIPVIVYGSRAAEPVRIDMTNYQRAPQLAAPDYGQTDMTGAMRNALREASANDKLTIIVNITDGNPNSPNDPNSEVSMQNEVIKSASGPVWLKNLAVKNVPFLEKIDDLPSRFEFETDSNGSPKRDASDQLVIVENPQGIRLIDNVDSQALDPSTASDDEFAAKFVEELALYLEMAARIGVLTDVPGVQRTVNA